MPACDYAGHKYKGFSKSVSFFFYAFTTWPFLINRVKLFIFTHKLSNEFLYSRVNFLFLRKHNPKSFNSLA